MEKAKLTMENRKRDTRTPKDKMIVFRMCQIRGFETNFAWTFLSICLGNI